MTTGPLPVCYNCQRLVEFPFCEAFGPEVPIPVEIASHLLDHTEPFPGDHGLLYLPIDGEREGEEGKTGAKPAADARDHGFHLHIHAPRTSIVKTRR